MSDRTIPRKDFDALVDHAGLTLDEAQRAELHANFGLVTGMTTQVRKPLPDLAAEPAHIFKAGE
jgi:hypothetical protein